jgi:HK97 family phage major capsid protein
MANFPEIKAAIDEIGSTFELFKAANDEKYGTLIERVEVLEARGSRVGGANMPAPEDAEHVVRFKAWLRNPHDERARQTLAQVEADVSQKSTVATATGAAGGFAVPAEISRQIGHRVRQLNPFRQLVAASPASSADFSRLVSIWAMARPVGPLNWQRVRKRMRLRCGSGSLPWARSTRIPRHRKNR